MSHKLPSLPYEYDALEPFIDKETMELHHGKHHKAYVDKLNTALEKTELKEVSVEGLLKELPNVPEEVRDAVRNNGGGHSNHTFFWQLLKKDVEFKGEIAEAIKEKFGSFDIFKEEFSKVALGRFGSGWAWLVLSEKGLELMDTLNQDSPLSEGKLPILGLDVWEHSYYKKYGPDRAGYVQAFFKIINWEFVNEVYLAGLKG